MRVLAVRREATEFSVRNTADDWMALGAILVIGGLIMKALEPHGR